MNDIEMRPHGVAGLRGALFRDGEANQAVDTSRGHGAGLVAEKLNPSTAAPAMGSQRISRTIMGLSASIQRFA